MFGARIDRRGFLGGAAALGALAAFPASARGSGWPGVQALLDSYVDDGRLPGVAGAIGRGTDPAVFLSAGTIARDSRRPVDPDSLWRIYSMTKPVTGMAAMILIDDGTLGLDQNIADFIPGFAEPRVLVDPAGDLTSRPAARPITVRHLLTHTAGLGYTIVTEGALEQEYLRLGLTPALVGRITIPGFDFPPAAPSLAEFADRLATLPLVADPGAKWSYSVSLDLLGRVIEVASAMPFDRFLQTRLFAPLGMASSFFEVPDSELHRLTTNYFVTPDGPVVLDAPAGSVFADPPPFPFGGAGLVSSARDYDRFLLMLAGEGAIGGGRVMSRETARLGMSNLLPDTVDPASWDSGFGAGGRVTIRPDEEGSGIGTFGWGGAAGTIGWVDRARGVRATGMAQYIPDTSYRFGGDFGKAVYAGL